MACRLMTYEEAASIQARDAIWRQAKADMAAARRTRTCVWCAEPVQPHRDYPACEDCREYRGVVAQ